MIALILPAILAAQIGGAPGHELLFSVELQDPIVHHLHLTSSVLPGQPFRFETHRGTVECTISGTVPSPEGGVYRFPIEIDETRGQAMSMKGSQNLVLGLNKPYSGGPLSSFIYMRTFKLTEELPSR